MLCFDKSQYISDLQMLFLCSSDGHINTGEFMTRLCDILSDEKNRGKYPYFDVFFCTKENGKFTLKRHKTLDKSQVLHFLFENCGYGGYEVYRLTDEGCKGVAGHTRFFYGIWICR
jgi:hypothetical protein